MRVYFWAHGEFEAVGFIGVHWHGGARGILFLLVVVDARFRSFRSIGHFPVLWLVQGLIEFWLLPGASLQFGLLWQQGLDQPYLGTVY